MAGKSALFAGFVWDKITGIAHSALTLNRVFALFAVPLLAVQLLFSQY